MSENPSDDLENFRRQWREEVLRKRSAPNQQAGSSSEPSAAEPRPSGSLNSYQAAPPFASRPQAQEDDYVSGTYDFDDLEEREEATKLGTSGVGVHPESRQGKEPVSALEHYEAAVESETQGKLGDSLRFYRKAFRLDDTVDQKYKSKHFPPSSFPKPSGSKPSGAVVPRSKVSLQPKSTTSSTLSDLVLSFADASIPGAAPIIAGDIPPPCPISTLPTELLCSILDHVASTDVAALSRLVQVCKRFAYLVTSYDSLWKRLVQGTKYGLAGQHFSFALTISWHPLLPDLLDPDNLPSHLSSLSISPSPTQVPTINTLTLPLPLPLSPTYPTYRTMFRTRPRLRYSGVYISTVNYTRAGAASPHQITWNSPVHIVTYYRYLRFYRDGSCVSLLTTTEPADVVPYLHREKVGSREARETQLPASVMRDARRGRWKLSAPNIPSTASESKANQDTDAESQRGPSHPRRQQEQPELAQQQQSSEPEGTLSIETEGPTATYTHHMRFSLRSTVAGGGDPAQGGTAAAQNTKLAWRGFWSHNKLTDDWAEFGLRNDRAYVWSRVRSWGEA